MHGVIGQRLLQLRKDKRITLQEVENATGIHRAVLSRYETDQRAPKAENLQKLADFYGVSVSWLITGSEEIQGKINDTIKQTAEAMQLLIPQRQTNVLEFTKEQLEEQQRDEINSSDTLTDDDTNYKTSYNAIYVTEAAAAGVGYAYGDNEATLYKTDRFDLNNYDFATLVDGDSMEPKYNDGDVVLIKGGYDNVNGAVYVVDYDGKSFLKRVFFEGNRLRLVSYNHKYKDIYIDLPVDDDIYLNILGKVVDSFTPIYDY